MLVHQVCGLTDPFCEHAVGAKIPDNSSARTLAYTFKVQRIITTNASGNALAVFFPDWNQFCFGIGTESTTTPGAWTLPPRGYLPIFTGASQYRVVSAGFTARRISNNMTTSGTFDARLSNMIESETELSGEVDALSFNGQPSFTCALQDVKDWGVVCQRSDMPQEKFYVQDTNHPLWTVNSLLPAWVVVNGGPASTGVLQLEATINLEFTFGPLSNLSMAATRPPPASPVIENAVARVTSTAPSFFSKTVDKYGDRIVDIATLAIGSYFGPAAGAASGAVGHGALDMYNNRRTITVD